jgi:hypothetical protein
MVTAEEPVQSPVPRAGMAGNPATAGTSAKEFFQCHVNEFIGV